MLYKRWKILQCIFLFCTCIPIYSSIIFIHTFIYDTYYVSLYIVHMKYIYVHVWHAIVLQYLSLLNYSKLVLTVCFSTSQENSGIIKSAPTKFQEIHGYLHDLQIELQVQAGCHPGEHHSTAALQLLQSMKNTFRGVKFGQSIPLPSYSYLRANKKLPLYHRERKVFSFKVISKSLFQLHRKAACSLQGLEK